MGLHEQLLDEDTTIGNQQYSILSYLLPEVGSGANPMIKIRGSYSTIEECENRIKNLQRNDSYFHMFVVETGKWGSLLPDTKLDSIDAKYQDDSMGELIKGYKDNKDKKDLEFTNRKDFMKQKAVEDGTKEGQAILSGNKEHYASVKNRLETSTEHLINLNAQIKEIQKIYDDATKIMDDFTEEEIENAILEIDGVVI
jgi:hypothetical protein